MTKALERRVKRLETALGALTAVMSFRPDDKMFVNKKRRKRTRKKGTRP